MIMLHWLVAQTVLRGDKLRVFEIPSLHTECVFQRHCHEQILQTGNRHKLPLETVLCDAAQLGHMLFLASFFGTVL